MNMFALTQLQVRMASRIAELSGMTVKLGRYCHQADSYHIYGSYAQEFEQRFIQGLKRRPFEERTFRYEDVKDIMQEAIPRILTKAAKLGRPERKAGPKKR
jgi:thymidylate synthase